MLTFELDDGLALHGYAQGQPDTSHRAPAAFARGSEHVDEQVCQSVDHRGLFRVFRYAVHEPVHFHHPLDVVQASELLPHRGEHRETHDSRSLDRLVVADVVSALTDDESSVRVSGHLTGDVRQVSHEHDWIEHPRRVGGAPPVELETELLHALLG